MDELLKAELANIKTGLETKTALEVKSQIDAFEAKVNTEFKSANAIELKSVKEELQGKLDALQAHADKLDLKLQEKGTAANVKSYDAVMQNALKDNFDSVSKVTKGKSTSLEIKAVGNMTIATNLTGSAVATVQDGVSIVPSQKINFTDLVPTVNSATGIYVIYRETGAEGSISTQTEGASKSQQDYDLTAVTFNAAYLSGFTRYSKQMAQDLPFLQSFLPMALRRDYFKAENLQFYTALAAAATASTTAKTVDVEQLVDDMGSLEAIDYDVTGIVLNPKDWANIAITKPNDYSLPGIVTFVNGKLAINGVPVYKASWVPVDKYLMGDWAYAKKIAVDGLAVEFFEQDADNVTKNLITARIEQRVVLGIDRPNAFILGDFGNVV
ncbi:phage major capsid protein [Flavobacterium sp.]|uniref:phage major capsid protein n=1 Tax=Flavobacterium sp. TaxID=239 RepID=UPI00375389E0